MHWKRLALILILLFSSGHSYAATWETISDTALDDHAYDWPGGNVPGTFSSIVGFSGAAYDSLRNRMLLNGGGHSDYGGQEIYAFDYDDLEWSIAANPGTYADIIEDCTCVRGFRTELNFPKASHSYGRIFYNAETDEFWEVQGGSSAYAHQPNECTYCANGTGEITKFDLDAGTWSFETPHETGGGTETAGDFNTDGTWWFVGAGGSATARFGSYTPSTDTWSTGAYDTVMSSAGPRVAAIGGGQFVCLNDGSVYAFTLSNFVAGTTKLSDNEVTDSGDPPPSAAFQNWGRMGFAYDPVGEVFIAWDSLNDDVYELDPDGWVWTELTTSGTHPGTRTTQENTGIWGRFDYVASMDKFVLVKDTSTDVRLLALRDTGTKLTTFDLTSGSTDTAIPFTVGLAFGKGDCSTNPALNLPNYQVEIMKQWSDGSVKHAIASGTYDSTADQASTITVYDSGTLPSGADLTEADIVTEAPVVTVAFSGQSWTTVSLANLLGSPDRTFVSGPHMVEAHYSQDVSEQSDIVVKFHVRLYSTDDVWIRVTIENGVLDGAYGTDYTYTPTVTVGSNTVYNTEVAHQNNTRWCIEGWINITDPDTIISHDNTYLMETELVPNYWKFNPSASELNGLNQAYTPMEQGDWRASMGDSGYHGSIGLIPNWDALYVTSNGDSRAFDSVIANAKAFNSYALIFRDPATDMPIVIETNAGQPGTNWDTWTVSGAGGGGDYTHPTGAMTWELNHSPSAGYLAYLITGDYFHLETMMYQSALLFLSVNSGKGSGTARVVEAEERGDAWAQRTWGQLAAIAPTTGVGYIASDFQSLLDTNITHWYDESQEVGMPSTGIIYHFHSGGGWDGTAQLWQQSFWVQTLGFLSDLEPLSRMTNLNALKNHMYKIPVGMLGVNGSDAWCFNYGGAYQADVTDAGTPDTDPTTWLDGWDEVYYETFASTSCGTSLLQQGSFAGSSPANADEGYWGNLLPAIAYAVEDGATGASAAWTRLTGATNWSTVENAGFDDTPVWGIYPRSVGTSIDNRVMSPAGLRVTSR